MKTWSNGAKKRLVEIRAAEDGEQDMRAIAASIANALFDSVLSDCRHFFNRLLINHYV